MEEPYADAGCVLRMNVSCPGCKDKIMGVLSSIVGVYDVNMDAEQGLVRVKGEVDPKMLVWALGRSGYEGHAELVRANIRHPQMDNNSSSSHCHRRRREYNSYGALEGGYGGSCGYARPLPNSSYYYSSSADNCGRDDYYPMQHYGISDGEYYGSTTYGEEYSPRMGRVVEDRPYGVGGCQSYCCQPQPQAVYVPSYPQDYNAYEGDQWVDCCSIM